MFVEHQEAINAESIALRLERYGYLYGDDLILFYKHEIWKGI